MMNYVRHNVPKIGSIRKQLDKEEEFQLMIGSMASFKSNSERTVSDVITSRLVGITESSGTGILKSKIQAADQNDGHMLDDAGYQTYIDEESQWLSSQAVTRVVRIILADVPEHSSDTSGTTLKMKICLEPVIKQALEYAVSWKPCQGDSLNLPDHRGFIKMEMVMPHSAEVGFITHAHVNLLRHFYKHQDSRNS
ncbi:hypothetical protein Tco_1108256 [Tanacetum coccineum]